LLDNEEGETTAKARKIREEGVHMLSTFEWDSESKKAAFWLRKDVIEGMSQNGKWKVYILED